MSALVASFRAELRAHPLLWQCVALSACAALGIALPDIVDLAHRVLS